MDGLRGNYYALRPQSLIYMQHQHVKTDFNLILEKNNIQKI